MHNSIVKFSLLSALSVFIATTSFDFAKADDHKKVNKAKTNQFWWPDQLDLSSLRDHDKRSTETE